MIINPVLGQLYFPCAFNAKKGCSICMVRNANEHPLRNPLKVNHNFYDIVEISSGTLSLIQSWSDRYEEYMIEVEKCNKINDIKKRGEALLITEADFNLWMDIYSESESYTESLEIQKKHDKTMAQIVLNSEI